MNESIWAVRGLVAGVVEELELHAWRDGDECNVRLEKWTTVSVGRGQDYFAALVDLRRQLESTGLLLLCCGARTDVYPSQMQRQATLGRKAYVLQFPRSAGRPMVVDIFDAATPDQVGSVGEQREWFERWTAS